MPIMVEAAIWAALKSRIDTLATDPPMTAYEPGEKITAGSDAYGPLPYIIVGDSRNANDRITIAGDTHIYSGTALLTIQWPLARSITHLQLMQIAGAVAAHFPAGLRMRSGETLIRTTRAADVLAPFIDGAIRAVPVRVPWSTL